MQSKKDTSLQHQNFLTGRRLSGASEQKKKLEEDVVVRFCFRTVRQVR